jgi:hypothetical protein
MIGVFVSFSHIFLLGILIFKGLTERRLYKSFGFKGLIQHNGSHIHQKNIEIMLMMHVFIYRNLNSSGGNLVAFAELGSVLMNFRTAAHEACIQTFDLGTIVSYAATLHPVLEGQRQSMKYC